MISLTYIVNKIDAASVRFSTVQWYAFGSATHDSEVWSDFDFLVVYQHKEDVDEIRKRLSNLATHFPIDILFMTKNEENETKFIKSQRCIALERLTNSKN